MPRGHISVCSRQQVPSRQVYPGSQTLDGAGHGDPLKEGGHVVGCRVGLQHWPFIQMRKFPGQSLELRHVVTSRMQSYGLAFTESETSEQT